MWKIYNKGKIIWKIEKGGYIQLGFDIVFLMRLDLFKVVWLKIDRFFE